MNTKNELTEAHFNKIIIGLRKDRRLRRMIPIFKNFYERLEELEKSEKK